MAQQAVETANLADSPPVPRIKITGLQNKKAFWRISPIKMGCFLTPPELKHRKSNFNIYAPKNTSWLTCIHNELSHIPISDDVRFSLNKSGFAKVFAPTVLLAFPAFNKKARYHYQQILKALSQRAEVLVAEYESKNPAITKTVVEEAVTKLCHCRPACGKFWFKTSTFDLPKWNQSHLWQYACNRYKICPWCFARKIEKVYRQLMRNKRRMVCFSTFDVTTTPENNIRIKRRLQRRLAQTVKPMESWLISRPLSVAPVRPNQWAYHYMIVWAGGTGDMQPTRGTYIRAANKYEGACTQEEFAKGVLGGSWQYDANWLKTDEQQITTYSNFKIAQKGQKYVLHSVFKAEEKIAVSPV